MPMAVSHHFSLTSSIAITISSLNQITYNYVALLWIFYW